MKKTIYTLALGAFLLASCSQEENPLAGQGEAVKVTFTANLSEGVNSRSNDASTVAANQMLCAVFTEDGNKELSRETVEVKDGKATFEPSLLKTETYNIVFWAYKGDEEGKNNNYDVTSLNAIKFTPQTGSTSEDIEVYTETLSGVTIGKEETTAVTLKRPLAKINIASSMSDWNLVKEHGETITSSVLTLSKCYDTYNALTGNYSSSVQEGATHVFTITPSEENTLTIKNESYFILASGYTLGQSSIDCMVEVKGKEDVTLNSYSIPYVPTEANYRTNIYSENFVAGSVKYTVEMEGYGETVNKTPEELEKENQENKE